MELDLLEKKIRRLVQKLDKHNVALVVFEHDDIRYGPVIGRGGEGVVHSCTVTYNGLPVDAAAKKLLVNSDDAISITLDEIELLCLGRDPIIQTTLRVYGVAAVPDRKNPNMGSLVIIMEAGLMNALQLYQEEEVPLHVTFQLWSQLAGAVHLLHTKKILHQDLKPENILITAIVRDNVGQMEKVECKIIDLGMGKRVFTDKVVTDDILGTNGYHPPEVLMEDSYNFRADVFMLGITFCVMLHSPTFLKRHLTGLLKRLHDAKKRGQVGAVLYENIIEPNMEQASNIQPSIRKMLIMMLEGQFDRDIELAQIVEICRQVAQETKEHMLNLPPLLSPCRTHPDDELMLPMIEVNGCPGDLLRHVERVIVEDPVGSSPVLKLGPRAHQYLDSGFSSSGILTVSHRSPVQPKRRIRRACASRSSGGSAAESLRTITTDSSSGKRDLRKRKSSESSTNDTTPTNEPQGKRVRKCRSAINYATL